jgi:hypothetical protein
MKCPHCLTDFHDDERLQNLDVDDEGRVTERLLIWNVCRKFRLPKAQMILKVQT